MWQALGLLGAGAALSYLTKPKYPDIKPYKPKPIAERMDQIDPGWQSRIARQDAAAQNMMTGDVPQATRDMIEMLAAEKAWKGGFGTAERSSNLAARDLGLYSLQLMQAGAGLSKELSSFSADLALAEAEQTYEAYASKTNAQLAKYDSKMATHKSLWDGIFTVGTLAGMGAFDKTAAPQLSGSGAGSSFSSAASSAGTASTVDGMFNNSLQGMFGGNP